MISFFYTKKRPPVPGRSAGASLIDVHVHIVRNGAGRSSSSTTKDASQRQAHYLRKQIRSPGQMNGAPNEGRKTGSAGRHPAHLKIPTKKKSKENNNLHAPFAPADPEIPLHLPFASNRLSGAVLRWKTMRWRSNVLHTSKLNTSMISALVEKLVVATLTQSR